MYDNKDHLVQSRDCALEASRKAMLRQHQLSTPCVVSALASVLHTSLSVVTRTPLATSILSTVGSKELQSKLSAPNSLAPPKIGIVARYNHKEDTGEQPVTEELGVRYRINGIV